MKNEAELRAQMVNYGRDLFLRGYATGGAGNLSIRLDDSRVLATPTGASLGRLVAEALSVVTMEGEYLSGDRPSKEVDFHRAIYHAAPEAKAIVHLHSTHLTALSCKKHIDTENVLQAFTPYYVMRVGQLPCIPYFRPGSEKIAPALAEKAVKHRAILMANHGAVVYGKDLFDAGDNYEELEETAKLFNLIPNEELRFLSTDEVNELNQVFG